MAAGYSGNIEFYKQPNPTTYDHINVGWTHPSTGRRCLYAGQKFPTGMCLMLALYSDPRTPQVSKLTSSFSILWLGDASFGLGMYAVEVGTCIYKNPLLPQITTQIVS